MNDVSSARPSPIAGTWYNGSPTRLRAQVTGWLDQAQLPPLEGEVLGVIAPHAGHRYSGRTAGHAFAAVRGRRPAVVAVLSPLHSPHPADLITTAHAAYSTPLGDIPVAQAELALFEEELRADGPRLARLAYDQEHSLEIELPFLQTALAAPFALLPVMVRARSPRVARAAGRALAKALAGRDALLVASTDLSHFYPLEQAQRLDAAMLAGFERFEPDDLFGIEARGQGYACGLGAVAITLWAARALGATAVRRLHYSTSADETGDVAGVVGYGAAAILKA